MWLCHYQKSNHIYLQSYRINRYSCDHYILLQKLIHKIFTVNFQASLRYSSVFLSNANLTISDVRISPIIVAHSTLNSPIKLLLGICIYKYATKVYDMLFSVNRVSTTGVRTSGVIFLTTLFVAILILIGLYLFFANLTPDKSSVFNNTANLIAIFSSVAMSLITVLRLGFKSTEGKYYLFLVVGIALWALAHSIWAYFELVLGIATPYPSIADFFWLLGYPFLWYHYYYSFRVWKQARIIRLRSLFIALISTSVLIGLLIYISLQGSNEGGFDLTTVIVGNLYLVGDGVSLVPAIAIMWSLSGRDVLLLHRVLVSLFIIINTYGDVGYVYHEMLVDETTFAQQEGIWWLVYTISYLVLTTGLIWYNRISVKINNNVQDALDKQYPYLEKLWNKTTNNDKSNMSESEKEFVEHFTNAELINHKIENTLRKTHNDILFLISTEEIFLRKKAEIYKFIKVFSELNVDVRILIPGSDGLRDLAFELEKHSKVRFQRLYRPFSQDFVIFVIDSNAILDLEFKKDEYISNDGKELLLYSEREAQVQSHIALFENCWMLPLVHEKIPNQ